MEANTIVGSSSIYNLRMVTFDPQKHNRHSIRLQGYDYSQAGGYFVTMVTWQREFLFGEILKREMNLSRYGEIVQKWWGEIPVHFPNVEPGAFVIMPNHVHGIIFILPRRGAVPAPDFPTDENFPPNDKIPDAARGGETPPRPRTLGQIVAFFKYQSTKEMNVMGNTGTVTKFWQRSYHEHVIRNEKALQNITNYIESNPILWGDDGENPVNLMG